MIRHNYFYHRDTETQSRIKQNKRRETLKTAAGFALYRFLLISGPLCLCGLILTFSVLAQVPSPKSVLGFQPTDDKTIADWKQITDYFAKLDKASNRVAVKEIGKTTIGKPLIVAFISSPDNIKHLDKLRQINQKLADP